MDELAIKIEHVSKEYRLGAIGGGTLKGDLQSWMARIRGKEDPNSKIGADPSVKMGEKFLALNDVSFEVKKGEAVGIIGHNGAGKSTLLKLLSRVTAPTKGTVSYNGRIASMLEVGTGFHPELTGRENVYMNGAILGMTKAEIDKKFDQIVEFAEMNQFIDTTVKRYSSGMYVKLAFSVAAHLDSEIMIMDEVLAVGDMAFQKKSLDKMRDAAKKEGRTVLYVSHNMNTIRQLCDRCIVLNKGTVIFEGDVEEAVDIYLGQRKTSTIFNECSNIQREEIGDHHIQIESVEFLNLQIPIIYDNDFLDIELKFRSFCSYENLSFRIIVFSRQEIPIGMAVSSNKFPATQGENTIRLRFDFASLAPGEYSGRIVLYETNQYGGESIHDVVHQAFFFQKEQKESVNETTMAWKGKVWGYISFPNVELL